LSATWKRCESGEHLREGKYGNDGGKRERKREERGLDSLTGQQVYDESEGTTDVDLEEGDRGSFRKRGRNSRTPVETE
jgi:hypothetical protein